MHRSSQTRMENKSLSSSCISPAAAVSVSAGGEQSSWAMHIANFLASPHGGSDEDMGQEAATDDGSGFSSSFSSSFDSLDDDAAASFITSELMCDDGDDQEEDESLQDTACSSAAGTKITSMQSKVTMDANKFHNMPQLAKYYSIDAGSQRQVTSAHHQEAINNSWNTNDDKATYECNELRKKGLCLVPISMLIDYLG